ncbi:rCG26106 [Rattus norvegicus]|uniref:RCG26106 n=1 Tax=Rattus norvegicus TaxID=10116 RepID=A6MGV8_RAT|nr:rCG26106 [Rattus norvegicus]
MNYCGFRPICLCKRLSFCMCYSLLSVQYCSVAPNYHLALQAGRKCHDLHDPWK